MMSGTRDQVKALLSRILRLKEEQDALSTDIREVYAEAKAVGFDKTALGQAVSIIRKRDKQGTKFDMTNAIVETYLHAYDGEAYITSRAHAHEPLIVPVASLSAMELAASAPPGTIIEYDPETGEIIGELGHSVIQEHGTPAGQEAPVEQPALQPATAGASPDFEYPELPAFLDRRKQTERSRAV